jgi:hypothetical protein
MIEEKLLPALGIREQHSDAQHPGDSKEQEYGASKTLEVKRVLSRPESCDQPRYRTPRTSAEAGAGETSAGSTRERKKRQGAYQVCARIGFVH